MDNGPLKIQNRASGSWETNIECNGNGNVELYHNNSKKLETTSSGATVTWAHHAIVAGAKRSAVISLILTIVLAIIFVLAYIISLDSLLLNGIPLVYIFVLTILSINSLFFIRIIT